MTAEPSSVTVTNGNPDLYIQFFITSLRSTEDGAEKEFSKRDGLVLLYRLKTIGQIK